MIVHNPPSETLAAVVQFALYPFGRSYFDVVAIVVVAIVVVAIVVVVAIISSSFESLSIFGMDLSAFWIVEAFTKTLTAFESP